MIWRIERGHAEAMTLATLTAVAGALDVRLDLIPRWRGGELDRLLNAAHSAMHERMAAKLRALDSWLLAPEVTFAVYGERGVIDLFAYHPIRRALLVIELKTEIVDIQLLMSSVDKYMRLASQIARDRDWRADTVSCWLVVRDTMTNRRRVGAHASVLRAAFPHDGDDVRRWLRDPAGKVRGLSFLSDARRGSDRGPSSGVQRVRRRPAAEPRAEPRARTARR
jgi:hypothetical protein